MTEDVAEVPDVPGHSYSTKINVQMKSRNSSVKKNQKEKKERNERDKTGDGCSSRQGKKMKAIKKLNYNSLLYILYITLKTQFLSII